MLLAGHAALPHLDLRGPHDLRHTFATWLEDGGIPSRAIDATNAAARRGWPTGTTPEMRARVVAAIEGRLAIVMGIVLQLSPMRSQPSWPRYLASRQGRADLR